ncbi:MAG: hypothetical protein FK733_04320 [Asgard group archaeon]|nr:hypothetical protein [Asgard group archaeon]
MELIIGLDLVLIIMDSSDVYCPYCGTISQTSDTNCSKCGASIDLSENIVSTTDEDRNSIQPTQKPDLRAEGEKIKLRSHWLAISSLILGIISVAFFLIPVWEAPFQIGTGVLAVAAGIFGIVKNYRRIQSITGLILGFIGIGLWILSCVTDIWSIWNLFW